MGSGMGAEDELVRLHHQLNRHELEQTPGDGEGRSLACCSSWVAQRDGHDSVIEKQTTSSALSILISSP